MASPKYKDQGKKPEKKILVIEIKKPINDNRMSISNCLNALKSLGERDRRTEFILLIEQYITYQGFLVDSWGHWDLGKQNETV